MFDFGFGSIIVAGKFAHSEMQKSETYTSVSFEK
jgi:hypothetical protein